MRILTIGLLLFCAVGVSFAASGIASLDIPPSGLSSEANPPAKEAVKEDKLLGGGVIEILDKGGIVMVLILIGSIVSLALAFERFVVSGRRRLVPQALATQARAAKTESEINQLAQAAGEDDAPFARILTAGLSRRALGASAVEQSMETQGAREISRLKRRVRPLGILATVQPLLGLLGTILGMIGTFNVLGGTAAAERVEKLAPGIGQALYTTAAGLLAAIPCVLLYHFLMGRVNRVAEEWSVVGTDLVFALEQQEGAQGDDA